MISIPFSLVFGLALRHLATTPEITSPATLKKWIRNTILIKKNYRCIYSVNTYMCKNFELNYDVRVHEPFHLSDQLQFSLSVSHQISIIQYGEFGNR